MKFFVPHAHSIEMAEQVWQSTRSHLARYGFETHADRIWRINFRHNGESHEAEVGKAFPGLRDEVLILLRGVNEGLLYACSPTRGVTGGGPYLIGNDLYTRIESFDS